MALGALALVVVLGAASAGAGWYVLTRPDHDIDAGETVEMTIVSGSNTTEIAEQLASAGVVDNARMFRLKVRNAGAGTQLKAGTYTLATGMGYEAALAELAKGPDIVTYTVTIPEGFTTRQIAARFAKRAGIPEDELLELVTTGAPKLAADRPYLKDAYRGSLEGYLFPATYTVKEGASSEQVVEMMLDKFDAEMAGVDLTYAQSKNLTLTDVMILASIVEREARLDSERPIVSSVIYNRLKAKMRLQLCATVLYEMPAGTTRLTYDDLKLDSPYNTYIHNGIPPGPISNPGIKSIKAAAQPKKTDYLYYVLTGEDGSHTFTSSYAAFQKAVGRSRELTGN